MQDARGNDVDLGTYKGKALLIVNVASQWFVLFSFSAFNRIKFVDLQVLLRVCLLFDAAG